ncbi:MAG: hypothetical protein H6737_06305 [Alphaproteobacteria bacterium]|nr:hypothetical protein [Alphaproteobacteria bacterium]
MAEREPAKKANDSEAARVPQSDAAVFGTEPVAAFVDRLAPTLREVVGRVASQHQSSSEDCPWLEHYLTRARGWSAELGARVLRRWLGHLPETPALLTQAIVFKVRASTEAWFAEGTTPSIVELCPEDVPEATQSVEGLAFVGVADARIAKQDRPIDYAHCEERNAHWWDELDLVLLAPFGAVTPHTRPVVFANQTYDLQKWLQYSDLDKSLLGERLIRDGVFGPRTLLAVRRLVRMPWQEVVDSSNRWRHDPDLVGDWLSVPLSRWGHLGTVALIEVQKRQDVEAWSSTTPTRGVLGFVWRHQLDDSMRRHLTDLYDLPHELDDVEDVELLEVLLVACGEETPWHTENVLYTVDRGWTNKLEYQRIVKQRLAAWDTAAPYFYFGIKNREALGLLETWAAPLPRTEAGTQAMGRIRGREAGAEIGDDGLAALAIGFVLPEIEVDVLQAAVDRVILAPRVNALLESEVERFTADLDRAFVAEEAAQMVSRLRAVDEDPGANPPDITSEAALLDFLKGGVGYDALLTELVEGKRPPFVIVKIGADDAFPIPADRVLLWRQQSIDQKGTFRPDQAPPHAYGLFPHSSKEGETESHRFTAEQDGESIRVVQANVGTFTYDPRQPVRIHTSELWKGVNSFFWLPLVAMGHLGFTTNEQWVFAAALPKVAAALQAQEKAETWSSALDVGFFIFGAGAVVAAPFVAAGGAAVGTASELAMFVGGELAGQWLTDEINAKMEDPNTTPEEREKYQRWMLYAMGAMLVMGVGAGAWRASGNNRAVARAARNLDTFGTVAGPSGARFLRTLAGKVDGYRAAKLEAVGLSEASETSVKSALGRAGDRITHVSDEGLMPGTIKVEFFIEDGLVEPGVVVRTAPRIRLADLAAHRPTIRAVESWAALPTRMGRLQTRVKAWLAGGKTPGSTAFRVDQEITKLQAMLDTRVRWLDGGFLSEAEALMVAQEAAVIARQMDDWAMVLRLPGLDPTRGGLITAKGTVNWDPEALAHWEVIEPFVARHRATVQGVIDAHPDVDAAMVALTESLMGRQISRPVFTPAPNTPQWGSLRDAWRRLNRYASDYAADPVPTIGFERTPGAGRALYDADTQTVRFGGAVPDESTFMHGSITRVRRCARPSGRSSSTARATRPASRAWRRSPSSRVSMPSRP